MTKKQKKIISYSVKICVLLFACFFIYFKINNNKNLHNFLLILQKIDVSQAYIQFGVVFFLMLLNWFIESLKWQYLIKKVEVISLKKAIESVFCGLTWAIFTPNRIGEYGGRIFFLRPRKRIQGMVAMSVGQIAQMVVTNVFGSFALVWFVQTYFSLNYNLIILLYFAASIFCLCFLLFFFNISLLNSLFNKINFLKRYKKYFNVLTRYKKPELLKVLLLSISRFCIFTSQYLIALHFLIPNIPMAPSALMVFILFFVQSALPSLDLLDIGVRSITSTYFFQFITSQEITVMAIAALIWLVNLIIPAILGSLFIFKLNFFGNNNS